MPFASMQPAAVQRAPRPSPSLATGSPAAQSAISQAPSNAGLPLLCARAPLSFLFLAAPPTPSLPLQRLSKRVRILASRCLIAW